MNVGVHERHLPRTIEIAYGNSDAHVGPVVADRQAGEVLDEGLNNVEKKTILRGEIDSIMHLAETRPEVDWSRLILYITAEPCSMCSSAILWCGIPHVVFGTSIESLERLGLPRIGLTCEEVVVRHMPFRSQESTGGVLERERARRPF